MTDTELAGIEIETCQDLEALREHCRFLNARLVATEEHAAAAVEVKELGLGEFDYARERWKSVAPPQT